MKPGEFDDLVRQKFDQNDFAYNPKNWERLAEHMDGRAKKRSMLMWLWMPAAGMAASVALALGVTSLLTFSVPDGAAGGGYASTGKFLQPEQQPKVVAMVPDVPFQSEPAPVRNKNLHASNAAKPVVNAPVAEGGKNRPGLRLENIATKIDLPSTAAVYDAAEFNGNKHENALVPKIEKKAVAAVVPMQTFRPENRVAIRKPLKFSVILSGGVNQGNNNSGYMAGATVRKMLNDKVYVESDIAFASSDNMQRTDVSYTVPSQGGGVGGGGNGTIAAKSSSSGSASKISSSDAVNQLPGSPQTTITKTQDVSYNLKYAQITPGIGYKIMKRMSIGVGPDFQQMLVDNRPTPSSVTRENIQVAPSFDVGFVGKTEYAFTNRVKAAVAYRKGMNGFINPSDKFIDRNYLQFQMKCTIFNK